MIHFSSVLYSETQNETPIQTSSFLICSSGRMEHLASAPSTDDEH